MSQDQDPNDLEWSSLSRYLTGELSPAEAAAVERWFEADSRHRALLDELRGIWAATGGATAGWNTDRAIAELRERALGKTERHSAVRRTAAERKRAPSFTAMRTRPWAALAAGVAAVLIGGGALGFHWLSRPGWWTPATSVRVPMTDVTTQPAQRAEVRLADGTRVTLGPASRLSYASDFGRQDRTVTLDGEAYFAVVHNGAKPFRVRTARGVMEDIGTAFVVQARAASLRVMVAEGVVLLRPMGEAARDSVLLTAGQLGGVQRDGRLDRVRAVQPDAYLAWTRGELVFEDTPLAEVAEELERWYDMPVRVADSVTAARRFSGRLGHRSFEEALRLVAAVADVGVRRTERDWIFQGRKSP